MVEGLKERKVDMKTNFRYTLEQTEEIAKKLEEACKLQKELGLGDSTSVYNDMMVGYKMAKPIKSLVKMVNDGNFEGFVEAPDRNIFPRFAGGENATTSQKLSSKPQVVMVALSGKTKSVTCTTGGSDYKANIPQIPLGPLELAKRVKEQAPDAIFHLAFEPSWEKQPQADPVLLAQLNQSENPDKEYWLNVASWDSDADLISSLLVEKKFKE